VNDYYRRRWNILIVAYTVLLGMWAFNWFQWKHEVKQYKDLFEECSSFSEFEPETERVMYWKHAWVECQEDIERYVEESREIVCWDTLVDWQEQADKEMRRCDYVYESLMTCESEIAEMRRGWHPAHVTPHTKEACEGYACYDCFGKEKH